MSITLNPFWKSIFVKSNAAVSYGSCTQIKILQGYTSFIYFKSALILCDKDYIDYFKIMPFCLQHDWLLYVESPADETAFFVMEEPLAGLGDDGY